MWRYHKNKYVLFLLWGCILLLSCAKKRVRACDSCLNQALMDVGENEPKKEESKKVRICRFFRQRGEKLYEKTVFQPARQAADWHRRRHHRGSDRTRIRHGGSGSHQEHHGSGHQLHRPPDRHRLYRPLHYQAGQ